MAGVKVVKLAYDRCRSGKGSDLPKPEEGIYV